MRIGELASRAGVSVRSVRYYEEQGLLTSTRSASGQRHYTEAEVERVAFIQRLYAAGLSSRTITELLPCVDEPSEENSDSALERMALERERLSAHIAGLVRTRDTLDELMAVARAYREQLGPAAAGQLASAACRHPSAAPPARL
nr:MerR family transcriptional regulator [Streptomyces sp. NBC_00857]